MAFQGHPAFRGAFAASLPEEMRHTVVEAFLRATNDRVHALEAAVDAGDLEAVARVAHAAKGSSGTFGAIELARLAALIEKSCGRGDLGATRDLVAAFASGFAAIEAGADDVPEGLPDR